MCKAGGINGNCCSCFAVLQFGSSRSSRWQLVASVGGAFLSFTCGTCGKHCPAMDMRMQMLLQMQWGMGMGMGLVLCRHLLAVLPHVPPVCYLKPLVAPCLSYGVHCQRAVGQAADAVSGTACAGTAATAAARIGMLTWSWQLAALNLAQLAGPLP